MITTAAIPASQMTSVDRDLTEYRLYCLHRNYNRIMKWRNAVDAAIEAAGGDFSKVNPVGRPPAKQVKYDMYDNAAAVARMIGIDYSDTGIRDLDGVRLIMATALAQGYTPQR